jgi:hypothetical protein
MRAFGPDLQAAEGPTVSFFGFPYPTRMAVINLPGGLFVWSPIALTPSLRQEVDALGEVRWLVSPNKLHNLFLGEWKTAYPNARLYAPPGLRRKRKDLAFDADLVEVPDPAWAAGIDQVLVRGSLTLTEAVFFHPASGTAIVGDLIQSLPRDWFRGWRGVLARLGGIVEPDIGTPLDWRQSFLDRNAARAALARILAWPIERVLIAHGAPASADGAAFMRRGLAWLRPRDSLAAIRNGSQNDGEQR